MIFTLEALNAQFGDSLLLHFGDPNDPKLLVIDGGPPGVYNAVLRDRLLALKDLRSPDEPLPIELVMVSHIDADHIAGILDLFEDLDSLPAGSVLPYDIATLWHNSFDDILGNESQELFSSLGSAVKSVSNDEPLPTHLPLHHHSAIVVASVPQGRKLRQLADSLNVNSNWDFDGLVQAPATGKRQVGLAADLKFTVLGPLANRVKDLQVEWDLKLKEILKKKAQGGAAAAGAEVEAAEFLDTSVFNLSSIVVLAELDGKTILLTGDARGDDILAGLQAADLLDAEGKIHVDVLKLPHHGSDRNVSTSFFRKVTADHYVISANGKHHNPDLPTLKMLSEARLGNDDFTIHLTNEEPRLDDTFEQEKQAGRTYKVVYRNAASPSLLVELGEDSI